MDELVAEIAAASKEQSQGVEQVVTAVSQMEKATQTTAAGAEECASAAQELNAQAISQDGIVRQLRELSGAERSSGAPVGAVETDGPAKGVPARTARHAEPASFR